MKEATGELSTTVIAVVAIAAVLAIFVTFLLPSLRAGIIARTYCSQAVKCDTSSCTADGGTKQCYYYAEDDQQKLELQGPIECDCKATE